MENIKDGLNNFMDEVKKDNPEANWGNLLTGIAILVLIAGFSIWYFGNPTEDRENLLSEILNSGENVEEVMVEETMMEGMVAVEAGEGLWNVAERVCGNGEAYNVLAEANELTIWSPVTVGQELVIACPAQ
ncbi:hypothetical protein HN803_01415 [candidate division WWE3 bacterium]|nr:hypothetical protein [candidate division WWE3 bacterium]MBT7349428.1 hypothetical protein [candidate division WWE3 bacterium]